MMDSSNRYSVVNSLTENQVGELHGLYQGEWWSKDRTLEEVRTVLAHSDFVFGVVAEGSGELLAFARVLTDRVFRAVLFDVIVRRDQRAAGVGSFLVGHITGHPVLGRVEHFSLFCRPELEEFYRRYGFTTEVGEVVHMRRDVEVRRVEG